MSAPLLTSHLCIGYKRTPIACGINLSAPPGSVTALLGANGSGKSTLLRTLSRELPLLGGDILINGESLGKISRNRLAKELSIVTAGAGMTGALTVRQLVSLGRQPYTGWSGILTSADHEIVDRAMNLTGISYKASHPMASLSDGERQKAMIARAVAQDTPIMLLDEPLSFLDPSARIEIFSLLLSLAKKQGKTIILSCHDIAMSLRMASRLWLLTPERRFIETSPNAAVSEGIIASLFTSPAVKFSTEIGDFIAAED